MALTEEPFNGVIFCCGIQTGLGAINSTVRDLAIDGGGGGLDSDDGLVLGYREAGDANSGITLPTIARIGTSRSDLANYTKQPTSFLRADISGLSLAVLMQGNGATTQNPAVADECQPLAGLHALWECSGLTGASGTTPAYKYTPAADSDYLTIKMWYGDHFWCFQDCMADVTIELVGGENGIATFAFQVGSLAPGAYGQGDGVTWPTGVDVPDYGTQLSLSAPRVIKPTASEAHEWSTDRGFNSYTLSIANSLERIPDSNQADGVRIVQNGREITLSERIWVDSADTDFEYEELIATAISTDTDWAQVGDPAGDAETVNAYLIEMETPEVIDMKHDRLGTDMVVDINLRAVAASAGAEFTLTFN
jgi:hypothetical protein